MVFVRRARGASSRRPPRRRRFRKGNSRMKAVVLLAALALASCSGGSTLSALPTGSGSSLKTPSDVLGGTPMMLSKLQVSLFDAPVNGIPGIKVNMGIDAVQVVKPDGSAAAFVTNA